MKILIVDIGTMSGETLDELFTCLKTIEIDYEIDVYLETRADSEHGSLMAIESDSYDMKSLHEHLFDGNGVIRPNFMAGGRHCGKSRMLLKYVDDLELIKQDKIRGEIAVANEKFLAKKDKPFNKFRG
jgi:hypothetical protein